MSPFDYKKSHFCKVKPGNRQVPRGSSSFSKNLPVHKCHPFANVFVQSPFLDASSKLPRQSLCLFDCFPSPLKLYFPIRINSCLLSHEAQFSICSSFWLFEELRSFNELLYIKG
uniref:Uncharacterized protein n=1 Tax=Sphaerodactylus townsendi TaxID=933632 RepID=A0ACB8EXY2_9SAUR